MHKGPGGTRGSGGVGSDEVHLGPRGRWSGQPPPQSWRPVSQGGAVPLSIGTPDVIQEVPSEEPPGPADLLTREGTIPGQGEDGFGADAEQLGCLLCRQDFIFRHFLPSPRRRPQRDTSSGLVLRRGCRRGLMRRSTHGGGAHLARDFLLRRCISRSADDVSRRVLPAVRAEEVTVGGVVVAVGVDEVGMDRASAPIAEDR